MWPSEIVTAYLIRWESASLAWVLYRSDTGGLLWEQIADHGGIVKDDPEYAFEWAREVIYRAKGNHRFTLNGPNNQILTNYTEID